MTDSNVLSLPATLYRRAGLRLLIAIVAVMALLTAMTVPSEARSRGRNIAIGVGVVGGLLILDKMSRAERRSYRSRGWSRRHASRGEEHYRRSKSKKRRSYDSDDEQASVSRRKEKPARKESDDDTVKETASIDAPEVKGAAVGQVISTPAEISAAQDHLRYLGYDVPHTTGIIDERTKAAALAFQTSIGATATGELTTEQLQALFVKVAGANAK